MKLKVLLVNNEERALQAVNWSEMAIHTILQAEGGSTAKALIEQERPEMIIMDVCTPLLSDSLDLLEWLLVSALPYKAMIVICSHQNWKWVQSKVSGSSGIVCLLKPVDPEQLRQALLRSLEGWNIDEKSRSQEKHQDLEWNPFKPVYRDNLLSTLLSGTEEYGRLKEQLIQLIPVLNHASSCRVSVLSLDIMEQLIAQKYAKRLDLLFYTLINICNEFITERIGITFRNWSNRTEIILLLWDELDQAEALINHISKGITSALQTQFDFGIGQSKHFPSGLSSSYKEALTALRKRNLLQPDSRVSIYREEHASPISHFLHLIDYEERIRIAIRSGREEQIVSAVDEWINAVYHLEEITVEQLELWKHEYSVLKMRWTHALFKEEGERTILRLPSEDAPYIVPLDSRGKLSIAQWREELLESMRRLMNILQNRRSQGGNVLDDIARYLDHHYAHDITLQALADQFFLSREYISRKFKQQFGESIVDYISKQRIHKSKLLLLNPLLKIADVGQAVGYQDEKYFSKVFKKLEGVSPNEYRKTL